MVILLQISQYLTNRVPHFGHRYFREPAKNVKSVKNLGFFYFSGGSHQKKLEKYGLKWLAHCVIHWEKNCILANDVLLTPLQTDPHVFPWICLTSSHFLNFFKLYWTKTTVFLGMVWYLEEFCKRIINFLSGASSIIDHLWLNAKSLTWMCTVWPYHVAIYKNQVYSQILHKMHAIMNKIKQNIDIRFTFYMMSNKFGLHLT